MKDHFFTIVNPAAGHGRCGKLSGPALERLRKEGLKLEIAETNAAGEAIDLSRQAYQDGYRRFIAVGGDGTAFEIINGLFPSVERGERPSLGFLPLGTGNSFLRDFSDQVLDHAVEALLKARSRPCDVLRLVHKEGTIHYINLLSVGFVADVATVTNNRFKFLGEFGYLLGVLLCLARLHRRAFPLRMDGASENDDRRCLFLTFNNSKYTGGKMMIAPKADTGDGLIEVVRWGPIGRIGLIANLRSLYDGTHIEHPLASRCSSRHIEFDLAGPVDVMVDGEVMALHCERLDVLPSAVDVYA